MEKREPLFSATPSWERDGKAREAQERGEEQGARSLLSQAHKALRPPLAWPAAPSHFKGLDKQLGSSVSPTPGSAAAQAGKGCLLAGRQQH